MSEDPHDSNTTVLTDGVLRVEVEETPTPRILVVAVIMLGIAIVMNAAGLLGLYFLDQDQEIISTTTQQESESVISHRVRNEESHACIIDFLVGLRDGVNDLIAGGPRTISVESTCPEPLSEKEIRDLNSHLSP